MSSDKDPDSKNHYSYEEMVARLRENRPQGSRVKSEDREMDPETGKVTVRRQKKRRTTSGNPDVFKDPKWFLICRRVMYVSLPVAVILVVVCYVIVMATTGTGRFQSGLGASLSRSMGLVEPVEIKESSLRGLTLGIKKATLPGTRDGGFRQGVAEGIAMRLHPKSFLGGDWEVGTCIVNKATILLGIPAPNQADTGAPAGNARAAGFLLSTNPANVHFSDVTIAQANLVFGGTDPLKSPGLRSVRCSMLHRTPESGAAYYDMQISGGRDGLLVLPGWPALKVETMRVESRDGGMFLKRSVLHLGEDEAAKTKDVGISMIEAKGTIPFTAGAEANIELAVRGLLLSDLIPKAANRYVSGDMRSEGLLLTYQASDPVNTWRLRGPVVLNHASLRGLRVIALLQQVTGGGVAANVRQRITGEDMATMGFEECRFTLDMTAKQTRLVQIQAVGAGRAQLTGDLEITAAGELSGTVKLGLSNEILLEKVPEFFLPGEAASSWSAMNVAGLVSAPSEDLSPKLQVWLAAQGASLPMDTPAGEDSPAGTTGKTPDQPVPRKDPAPPTRTQQLKDRYEELLKEPASRGNR